MKEDYVSFEIAKLLKEKGFDEETRSCYYLNDTSKVYLNGSISCNYNSYGFQNICVSAPTLWDTIKWLREVHNIIITIHPNSFSADGSVYYKADIWFNREYVSSYDIKEREKKVYEESIEYAIKYCLEHLI